MKKLKLIAFVAALSLTAGASRAQDSALLDLLVKKKVITEQEADQTKAELAQEYAATPAGKLSLSTPVQQIRLYGDARVRYEYREAGSLGPAGYAASDTANADRARYRLRLGADVTLTDNWFLGVRLETSNDGRSTNVTESNTGSGAASGQAGVVPPFGKAGTTTGTVITGITTTTAVVGGKTVVTGFKTTTGTAVTKVDFGSTIFVGQLYLKYKAFPWLTVEAGKIPNPFITTPMIWDPDINPEGFAEQFKFTIGPWGGGSTTAGYDKDGKSSKDVITSSTPGGITIDLFANLGQFVYDTASPENQFTTGASSPSGRNDTWLFGTQVGARVNFPKSIYLQAAPTFYNYSGDKGNDFSANYSGDPGGNQIGINDLAIVDIPAEFGWKSFGIPIRIFGDIAYNLDSGSRSNNAGHPGHNDGLAWQAGLAVNQIKKKGDWTLAAYWQYSGAYSLDPNLVDNDIFDSHLNMQGVVFQGGYALADAVTLNLQYNYGQIIDKSVGTGGSDGTFSGATSNPALRNYNLLQVDLNVKF